MNTREKLEKVLSEHWMESRGMSFGTPDRCSCGTETRPRFGDEDVSLRRADAFAEHQAAMVIAANLFPLVSPATAWDEGFEAAEDFLNPWLDINAMQLHEWTAADDAQPNPYRSPATTKGTADVF